MKCLKAGLVTALDARTHLLLTNIAGLQATLAEDTRLGDA